MEKKPIKIIIELIVVSVAITSGIHFVSTIIRNRYYGFLETNEIDPGVMHVLDYLGHLAFLAVMIGYAFAVPSHRKYFFSGFRGNARKNVRRRSSGNSFSKQADIDN